MKKKRAKKSTRKKKHTTRPAWGYPKDMSRPPTAESKIEWATACTCGWNEHGLSEADAKRKTAEHRAQHEVEQVASK